MSPLIRQYIAIKEKYQDAILLFRVGDFYETFNEDAKIVAKYLNIILTTTCDSEYVKASASLPPFHLDKALHTLVKAGYKVGICDPLEAPKAGPMRRGIISTVDRGKGSR